MLVKHRNAIATAIITAALAFSILLFSQVGCGIACPDGESWDASKAQCTGDEPSPVAHTIFVYDAATNVGLGKASVTLMGNDGFGWTFMPITGRSPGYYEAQVALSKATVLGISRECYETHVGIFTPTGSLTQQGLTRLQNCGGGDGTGVGDIYPTFADCVAATAALYPLADAVKNCCARAAFEDLVSTNYYMGGYEVDCTAANEVSP